MKRAGLLLAGAVMICSVSGAPYAQQPPTTFRSSVDVVFVPVTVTEGNRPVLGLTAADFQLLDNGVAQEVASAPAESLPVDVTLVLDTSGSVKGRALDQFTSDVQEISESLQPNDRVRLMTFAVDAADVSGLQPGGVQLPVDRISAGGGTSFYNALAAALIAFPRADRPQLVFGFSDGLDNMSFLDASHVVSLAGHSGASLYLALVQTVMSGGPRMTPYAGGPNLRLLREAAARTGGAVYEKAAGTPLPALFRQVLEEFRASYVLSYTPRGVKRQGWHTIVVRAKNPRHGLRWRKGYDGG